MRDELCAPLSGEALALTDNYGPPNHPRFSLEIVYNMEEPKVDEKFNLFENGLGVVATKDIEVLVQKNAEYGESWKKRGGVGAFMMLARKWDRLEAQVGRFHWDIFDAATTDTRPEGIMDDIRDLRRYLLLLEQELNTQMAVPF